MILLSLIILVSVLDVIPAGDAFLRQLQPRDSVLVADQVKYGFSISDLKPGTSLAMADMEKICNDTLVLVKNWSVDTVSTRRKLKKGILNLECSVVLAPFEEGVYELPPLLVERRTAAGADTLVFSSQKLEVKSMPVDTATFSVHPLKAQLTYPVTLEEVLPVAGVSLGGIALIVLAIIFLPSLFRKKKEGGEKKDPAHIVALRELDKYRSDKYWAPERQKAFYSGVTDTLKTYVDERFGIDAPEMTTAELFASMKDLKELTPDLYNELKDLFERADYVKFAKYVVEDKDNAGVLPLAVRFVTDTYRTEIEEENKNVL